MTENWIPIEEFKAYEVSDLGRVANMVTGRILRLSKNRSGIVKVDLREDGKPYTRSVKVVVAESFVIGRSEVFDTPIQLDGDQENCRADNLAWRPRWFAWAFTQQAHERTRFHLRGPVIDLDTGEVYKDIESVSIACGLLVKDVWFSIAREDRRRTFPTWQAFAFTERFLK